jgi:ADP-ribose pyrophosphatase YjhB (NUDIX family)
MFLPPNTILSVGPVIVEDGKVLLLRETQDYGEELFMFPGTKLDSWTEPLRAVCMRQTKEQLGCNSAIVEPLETMIVQRPLKEDELVILVHYLVVRHGEIFPSKTLLEWGWYDIYNLPKNCTPNVYTVMQSYRERLKSGTL